MNTNQQGMAQRCPAARPLGAAVLMGHRFRFAGPADVQVDHRHNTDGVLWQITDQCLLSLDSLEGYPYFYNRKWAWVKHDNQQVRALVYFMQPGNRNRQPTVGYLDCVTQGYRDFGVPTQQIWACFSNKATVDQNFTFCYNEQNV
jgi:gamma-glutamylcyclotransferase (GGCT)/AIG2-like uncharacterized protein YtfP